MFDVRCFQTVLLLAFAFAAGTASSAEKAPPPLVSLSNGSLHYENDGRGNRVPDFSNCGYAGGDREIPAPAVQIVVPAKSGDSTARIQKAIDYVASLPPDSNGVRGAVLLLKGRHEIAGGLRLNASGVVLRGQGMGENGTILFASGLDRRTLIRIAGKNIHAENPGVSWQISDDYVPVGSTSFHVKDPGALKAGMRINVIRPSTKEWIDRLGATEFGGGIGDWRLTWKPGTRDLVWDRVVKSVDGDLVTVDAPITSAIESGFGGGHVETCLLTGRIGQIGVENLRLESAFDAANPKDENHSWMAITMENAEDIWVRQVAAEHFAGSMVAIYESCKHVTVQDCVSLAPVSEDGGYRRNTFFTMGQLTLFLRCVADHGLHDFSAGHCAAGPNAFVQCEANLPLRESGPIESWASGVLYDNVTIDGNGLSLGGRTAARGVGWPAANSVLWNCSAAVIRVYNPPTAQNWAFGSWGEFEGDGIWRGSNDFMSPDSLYVAQVRDRLGDEAAKRIQFMPRPHDESSNPPIDKAQELAAASHQPPPLLRDYIAAASKRDLIPAEAGSVKRVDDLPGEKAKIQKSNSRLAIVNGWLTCDGKLLVGSTADVAWWRGNIRPDEAPTFGAGLTRFVPGRIGPGFIDDLDELSDGMKAKGQAALDHNYGLWYDRRRDDHERVRRMNGDAWPPFYEQPFARSGQGAAWDGLSKYDLTRFNPWYWSRLKDFAGICDERGLVLFHQNYFQHNIIEAGAHWADCPWRSANNINNTGFPEPPPFAGDKRIFQAELFYDVNQPVRRKLHEGYIRQCLDNFATNSNVIQFTAAEFTGPLHFMQFWLDTIGGWEKEHARSKPIIALSCTKDVQDAILSDSARRAVVDVIDFRYWWRTDKGEFAPPGGKNLAPRQFERLWRGGKPNDASLAAMAAEYRVKFPAKPLICDFDTAGWAWVCAGGSLPRLPKTTDAGLLAAIPKMQPWSDASKNGRWVLRESGKQFLIGSAGGVEFDLSGEAGLFRVNVVSARTGEVTPGESVKAGGKVKLPDAAVVWLVKE
jgi:hypothetical protein